MNIWNFIKKDWAIFFKDRGAVLWLFILPLIFIIIFSGLARLSMGDAGASSSEEKDDRAPIAVVNLDPQGAIARQFVQDLDRQPAFRVQLYEQEAAEESLRKVKIARYLLIPVDFSSRLAQGQAVTLTIVVHPDADASTTQTVMRLVNGVANDISLELQILDGIRQMGEMQANNPAVQSSFNAERIMQQAKEQFERSRLTPLISINERAPQTAEKEREPLLDLSQSFVPGFCVLFVFLSASTVARSLLEERKSGALRRLVAAPITRAALLASKMAPVFLLTLVQIAFIFLVGATLLPVLGFGSLSIGQSPLAWVLTSIVIALCSTCLGILIAGLVRTEGQVSGLSSALLWVAGFLGGAIFPPFIIQRMPVLNVLSRLVPQSYATTAYYDVLTRGKDLLDIWPNLLILLAFSALFFFVGTSRFKFE
jgi:ABC-2 type transport system permease protein